MEMTEHSYLQKYLNERKEATEIPHLTHLSGGNNKPIFSRFLKVVLRVCVFQQEYSPLGVCTFLILSENTWYKGRALISFGFEMSTMTLSGSQAKDRDWSFGVHSSKTSLSSMGQRKKSSINIQFQLQKDSNMQGWSVVIETNNLLASCPVKWAVTQLHHILCQHVCCHGVSSAVDEIMFATVKK